MSFYTSQKYLLYPSPSGKVAGVVWYKNHQFGYKIGLDKDAKCARIDALATNARSIKRLERVP